MFDLPEGRLPAAWGSVKEILEGVARSCAPDVIIAPSFDDAHQDHRTIGELLPTVFRDQLYLAYEIPKWDGDMSRPSMYVPLSTSTAQRKVELLHKCFPSQRGRDWWDDEVFLVFTDAPLPDMIARFEASRAVVSLLAVPPQSSHHVVDIAEDGLITQVTPVRDLRQWENGGYFVLRPEIFDYLNEGEDLVEDALGRLIPQRRVLAYSYKGYWSPGRHGQGTRPAGRDVPPRTVPVDGMGPGTLGRGQECRISARPSGDRRDGVTAGHHVAATY